MTLEQLNNIYHQLLLVDSRIRYTPTFQKALCDTRDEISSITGEDDETVQVRAEQLALEEKFLVKG